MLVVDLVAVESFTLSLAYFYDILLDVVVAGYFFAYVFKVDGE